MRKRQGVPPTLALCSRNAYGDEGRWSPVLAPARTKVDRIATLRAVLAACAQWEINQPSPSKKKTSKLGGIILGCDGQHGWHSKQRDIRKRGREKKCED
jgi:hypothetical protein